MKVCKGLHLRENECIVVTKERHQKPRESCSAFVMQLVTGAYIAQGAMRMGIHSESPFDESLEELGSIFENHVRTLVSNTNLKPVLRSEELQLKCSSKRNTGKCSSDDENPIYGWGYEAMQ